VSVVKYFEEINLALCQKRRRPRPRLEHRFVFVSRQKKGMRPKCLTCFDKRRTPPTYLEVEKHFFVYSVLLQSLDGDIVTRFQVQSLIYNTKRPLPHFFEELLEENVSAERGVDGFQLKTIPERKKISGRGIGAGRTYCPRIVTVFPCFL